MREFIECFDHVFIKIDKDEEKALNSFGKNIPVVIIRNNTYVDFVEYLNIHCKNNTIAKSAFMTNDKKICCRLEHTITDDIIVLLNSINLDKFTIYAVNNNLFIDFYK